MGEKTQLLELLEAGKRDEALALLRQPTTTAAATGERPAEAALAAAVKIFAGDVEQTRRWMTSRNAFLGKSPQECAEQSTGGLNEVLHMIAQIEAGIYV